ncbi:MAG: 2-amino-4-hydroxy-6-hydroxymethyldihydropteridine diphosphokinase [Candidatus Caenarcaniphilales bacterium]|nr:2-amino-4-hydroxy-6-hydroxymethyldihydropteridine diphosphokinase [Candidatus Caenarcaniphilales bacterium]
MHTAFLSLGSNLGDKLANLKQAVNLFENSPKIELIKVSSWLSNPAIEEAGPHDFMNGVVKIKTDLSPTELLNLIQKIELDIDKDRSKRGRKYARMIDIDILLYDDLKLNSEDLIIPHPRMLYRYFVTHPLTEIEPNWSEKYQYAK